MDTLEERVKAELSPVDMEARFCEMLDECYSFASVGGIFAHMQPSRVLQEVDPTAFRCGVADMSDDETLTEIDGDYYNTDDVDRIRGELENEQAD